ncbi:MAG: helix-turn-helix transcriptional regulator [Steroidobacteraceae bacterium]
MTSPTPFVRMLRLRQVEELSGLSRDSIYRLGKAGKFPRPVKVSERASRWSEAEVVAWREQCIAAARAVVRTEKPAAQDAAA